MFRKLLSSLIILLIIIISTVQARLVKYPPNDHEGYQELEHEQEDLEPIDNPLDQPTIIDYNAIEQCRRLRANHTVVREPDIMSRYTNHGCLLKCYYYDEEGTVSVHPVEDGQNCYDTEYFSCRHGYCTSRRHIGRLKFSIISAELPISEETYVQACIVRTTKLNSFPPDFSRLFCRSVCQTTVAPQSNNPRWNHECFHDARSYLTVPLNSTIILKVFNTRNKEMIVGGASISIANIFNYELNGQRIRRNITGGYLEGGVIYGSVEWTAGASNLSRSSSLTILSVFILIITFKAWL